MNRNAVTQPRRFDTNLVVIGAGAGGLVSAYVAATLKAKVVLVESQRMGGDCLNTGCVPSKTLLRSARLMKEIEHAASFGIDGAAGSADFAAVMARVRRAITTIEPHDSAARFRGLGVEVIPGRARLNSPCDLDELDRAITDGATGGFVKVLTVPGKDRILGATIVGERAGDLLAEFVLAMKHGVGLKKIFATSRRFGKAARSEIASARAPGGDAASRASDKACSRAAAKPPAARRDAAARAGGPARSGVVRRA